VGAWLWILAPPLLVCALTVPQFPHLENGDNHKTYLLELLRGLSVFM
jgi:hypothetical protein